MPTPGALFVGHDTVLVASARARVLVDPDFRPAHVLERPDCPPMPPKDLGRVEAVRWGEEHQVGDNSEPPPPHQPDGRRRAPPPAS